MPVRATTLIAIACIGLGACKPRPEANGRDAARADKDRALAGPLGEQIVVDPARAGQQHRSAAAGRTPRRLPDTACAVRYDRRWADRLPPELPLYPGASVGEAAGSDARGCRRRIVSFASAAPAKAVVAFYAARARAAGYSVEHLVEKGSDILGGTRGGAAYYLTVTRAGGGHSAVDLMVNPGD